MDDLLQLEASRTQAQCATPSSEDTEAAEAEAGLNEYVPEVVAEPRGN